MHDKNERLKENDGKPFTWKIKPKERIETKRGIFKQKKLMLT